MFNWLLGNSRTTIVADAVHQLCHASRYAEATLGEGAGERFLSLHQFLLKSRPAADANDSSSYQFGPPLDQLEILVDRAGKMQVWGHGIYEGLVVTPTERSYVVFVSKPISRPPGRNAHALAREFVKRFDALDSSRWVN